MDRGGYKQLDMDKIKRRGTKIVSSKEALADVVPIPWSDDVLSGKVKVVVVGGFSSN